MIEIETRIKFAESN